MDYMVYQYQVGSPYSLNLQGGGPTVTMNGSGMGMHPIQAKDSVLEMSSLLFSQKTSLLGRVFKPVECNLERDA